MKYLITALAILLMIACQQQKMEKPAFKVGTAQTSITPQMGAYIAGDKNNRQFTGVHDSIYVKAVVVSDAKQTMAFLVYDCIGMLNPTLEEVRAKLGQKLPANYLDPSHIVMSSTHTHSGPDVVGIWGADQMSSGVDKAYMEALVQKSSEVLYAAWENREPTKIVYVESEFGADWVYNISDSLNLDRALTSMQFLNKDGKSLATLNNFACHPTIMDGVSSEVSADYVSGMYNVLNDSLGGVNLFLQGAIGGWVQPEYEPKNFASVEKRGKKLGQRILQELKSPQALVGDSIAFQSRKVMLPVSNQNFQALAQYGIIDRTITDSVQTELAWFSIGEAQFVTHPGESTPTHSKQSKQLMKAGGPKFVLGLGMDALGYILTPDFYVEEPTVKHSGYLQVMSIDPEAGNLMMQHIEEMAGE